MNNSRTENLTKRDMTTPTIRRASAREALSGEARRALLDEGALSPNNWQEYE